MFLPSDQKSNNPFLPGSSIVTGDYPPDPNRSAGAAPDIMQQQMYAPPPGPPNQRNYHSEVPPPAYDNVPSAGARALNTDVKFNPGDVQSAHPMTPEPFAGLSGYAGPSANTQTARGGFSGPSSFRPDMDPQYTPSYLAPSTPPSRNLLSFGGGNGNAQNLTQSPGAPSFYRPAAQNLFYNSFPPTYLIANGKNLENGFPVMPPPSPVQPHPFISHDVNEADWTRFLGDLKKTATLSGGQKLAAGGASLVAPSFVTGLIVSSVVKNVMKDKKKKPVSELIDSWNHHFFHPRRLEVILAKGQDRVDSLGPVPNIDPQIEQMAPRLNRTSRSSSISSSSSSSSSSCRSGSRRDRRERKREDRQIRREEKRDRRERKCERRRGKKVDRDGYDRKYRLFVVGL